MWSCLQYMSSMFSFSMQQDLLTCVHQLQVNVSDQWMFWLRGGPSSLSLHLISMEVLSGRSMQPKHSYFYFFNYLLRSQQPCCYFNYHIYTIPTIALTRVWSVSYHMERSYSNWWPYTACITGRLHASALQLLCRIVDVTAWQPRDLVANIVSI